ncbi:MAG: hypothetical protein AB8E87_06510 [Prochlorococcus sp.]
MRFDAQANVDALIAEALPVLISAHRSLQAHKEWTESIGCVVIDARKQPVEAKETTVKGLTGTITTSIWLDHPLLLNYEDLVCEHGSKRSLEMMMNSPEAEEFASIFDGLKEEKARFGKAPVWTMDDAVRFVGKTKEAFANGELGVLAILPPVDGDEFDHIVVTFAWSAHS